ILGSQPFPKDSGDTELRKTEITTTHILVLLNLLLGITVYVAGVFGAFGEAWSLTEMAAVFIMIMVVTTLIARIGVNQSIQEFIKGANSVLYGALIIGMARSIVVILEDGMILDTVVNGMASLIDPFSSTVGAILMFIGNGLFNILVSSGSGQAAIVMPIMAPLSDL